MNEQQRVDAVKTTLDLVLAQFGCELVITGTSEWLTAQDGSLTCQTRVKAIIVATAGWEPDASAFVDHVMNDMELP